MKYLLILICLFYGQIIWANEAVVTAVMLHKKSPGHYNIDVTLLHNDEGWQHYADAWIVYDQNKNEIARRVLHHPHVNEQPFTRSLRNVVIPEDQKYIYIQANDKQHGLGKMFKKLISN